MTQSWCSTCKNKKGYFKRHIGNIFLMIKVTINCYCIFTWNNRLLLFITTQIPKYKKIITVTLTF